MSFAPCSSCRSSGACFSDCECAKCMDPEGYADWRKYCPEEHDAWVERQRIDDG